ncbi:hypothetical protein [Alienimonas chondri]|uniref:Uncharacterized protein n=1 Tax=Alienimonas chondri TaxID=2681879 RepID=A0ABX1VIW7_9PLAN|nr:hypothetical protein [Alienimonas chondri]NNJ27858.1 hypothetical protein [Alienimonas chondri]
MRYFPLLGLLLLVGCGKPDPAEKPIPVNEPIADEPAPIADEADPKADDLAVFRTVLQHMAKRTGDDALWTSGDGVTLYISNESLAAGRSGIDETQISVDIRGRTLPDGVLASFYDRNAKPTALPAEGLESPTVTVGEFEPGSHYNAFMDDVSFPDFKAIVTFWRPGYSTDGRSALVRFIPSPTPHGATGYYLLRRTDDGWAVEWFETAYYV